MVGANQQHSSKKVQVLMSVITHTVGDTQRNKQTDRHTDRTLNHK